MGSMESSLADTAAGPATAHRISLDSLRREAQLVANDLVALIAKAGDAGRGRPGRDALVTELTDLLDRVQSFSRLLSIAAIAESSPGLVPNSPPADVACRSQDHSPRLERSGSNAPGASVRDRMNAISDELGLPRVIVMAPASRPLTAPDRSIAAHVDHAVAWLDEFLAESGPRLRKTRTGSQFAADVTRLRNELLTCAAARSPASRPSNSPNRCKSSKAQPAIERSCAAMLATPGCERPPCRPVPAISRGRPEDQRPSVAKRLNCQFIPSGIVREKPGDADRRQVLGQAPGAGIVDGVNQRRDAAIGSRSATRSPSSDCGERARRYAIVSDPTTSAEKWTVSAPTISRT